MKFTKPIFVLPLILSVLACTLTAQPTPAPPPQTNAAGMVAKTVNLPQPDPATIAPAPKPKTCQVTTGLSQGRLNVRACGDVSCPVLATVNEGETLTPTQAGNGWLEVETATGLIGWVNSKFTNCTNEVTK